MKKLIVAVTTLILSASAMAGIQDKAIASHTEKLKQMNYEFCVEGYPKDFCDKMNGAFDGMVEMISQDGILQGLQQAKRTIDK